MKKLLITSVILAIVLSSCSFGKKQEIKQPEQTAHLKIGESRTLTQWLKDEPTIDCSVTTPEGKIAIKEKNGKIRIDGIPYYGAGSQTPSTGSSITDGDWMYIWSGKQGTKMSIQKLKEMSSSAGTTTSEKQKEQSWEDSVKSWEEAKYDYTCAKNGLSDDLFVPPTGVNFSDLTQMLNNVNVLDKVGQDVQERIKKGETVNQEDIEAQIDALKKQQGNTSAPAQ
jgi:hypothetical protein